MMVYVVILMQAFQKSHLLKLRVAPSETAMNDVLREVCALSLPLTSTPPLFGYQQLYPAALAICLLNCLFIYVGDSQCDFSMKFLKNGKFGWASVFICRSCLITFIFLQNKGSLI